MKYLLFNPLANGGKNQKSLVKAIKILRKEKHEIKILSVLDLNETKEELSSAKETDDVVIVGGDGTLHQVLVQIDFSRVGKIFMCRGGSGNDFARTHKGFMFDITDEIKCLPSFTYNGITRKFLNGIGMGVDAHVCALANENRDKSYFKIAIKALKTFKPLNARLTIDGEERTLSNLYFFVVMHGKYIGGGMKIAPDAVRDDGYLDVVLIKSKGFLSLLLIFPLVFFGLHRFVKSKVEIIKAKSVVVNSINYDKLEADGEVITGVNSLEISI